MTILFLKLLGYLPGLLSFGTSILGKLSTDAATRYVAATTASGTSVQAVTSADVSINTLKLQESEANGRWWVTAWEKPLLFYLCLMHFGAVAIDTTFQFHWGVPKLPSPYDSYQGVVLLSDVIVMSTTGIVQKVVSAIWK